jgi:hypothetical protein
MKNYNDLSDAAKIDMINELYTKLNTSFRDIADKYNTYPPPPCAAKSNPMK